MTNAILNAQIDAVVHVLAIAENTTGFSRDLADCVRGVFAGVALVDPASGRIGGKYEYSSADMAPLAQAASDEAAMLRIVNDAFRAAGRAGFLDAAALELMALHALLKRQMYAIQDMAAALGDEGVDADLSADPVVTYETGIERARPLGAKSK